MKKIKLMGTVVLLSLMALVFTGCDVTVTLTDSDGSSFSSITDSTGTYTFLTTDNLLFGDYSVTVEKAGYAFTPLQISLASATQVFDPVVGIQPSENDALLFVLMWDDGATLDVDAYMTYPTGTTATSPISSNGDASNYEAYVSDITNYSNGFAPENGTLRAEVSTWSTPITGIVLDVDDVNGTGPETISVGWTMPWHAGDLNSIKAYNIVDLNVTEEKDAYDYYWAGTMEYYVDGFGDTVLSTQGSSTGAHPVLYIFSVSGTGATLAGNCIGIYEVPDYTDVETASLARIQVFTDSTHRNAAYYFAIYPDIRLIPEGSTAIRSITTGKNEPLVVSRRK